MADIKRYATATWQGDLPTGNGLVSAESGSFKELKHSVASRFQENADPGTNPEELIGSAHAICFNMVLSKVLSENGNTPEKLETRATVTLKKVEDGFKVSAIHLQTNGEVPGVDESAFQDAAEAARANCPISMLLKPGLEELSVEAKLL